MKMTRHQKEKLGFGLLVSAMAMVVSFAVVALRKRSIMAAFAMLAAAEGAAGYLLLTDPHPRKKAGKHAKEETLFTPEECDAAEAHVRRVLGGRQDGEVAPKVLRDIPQDEDATEADFQ